MVVEFLMFLTTLIVSSLIQLGFTDGMGTGTKLNKLAAWAAKYISKKDSDPEHFDVFSFLSE